MGDRPPPPATEPDPAFAWLWRAWNRLHPDRPMHPVGMGAPFPGRIPWRDVTAWADRNGCGEAETEALDAVIQALDEIYITHEADRRDRESRHRHPAHHRR